MLTKDKVTHCSVQNCRNYVKVVLSKVVKEYDLSVKVVYMAGHQFHRSTDTILYYSNICIFQRICGGQNSAANSAIGVGLGV